MKKLCLILLSGMLALNANAQWVMRSPSLTSGITDLNVLNQDTIFASSAESMGLLKSVNGGQTWDTVTFGATTALKVHFTDRQHGFVAGFASFPTGPSCFKTSDCGQTWQPMYDTISAGSYFYKIRFLNKDTGFISDMGVLSRTTDGGATFTRQELVPDYHYITNIYFVNQTTGFVSLAQYGNVTNLDRIFKTTNSGTTWTEVYSDTTEPQQVFVYDGISQMHFSDAQHGWAIATGMPGKILRTTNGGNSWTELTGHNFTDMSLTDVHFSSPTEGYVVYAQSIYKTTNGGQSWTKQLTSPQDMLVLELEMLNSQVGFASGHGLFKTINGGAPTSLSSLPAAEGGFRFYPNPSRDIVYIQNEQQQTIHSLSLYDMTGRECKHYDQQIPASLSLADMADGVYFMRIQTNKDLYTGKIQLIK